jgi:heme/copper-type cytochrome/quinol oxidase subunit 1
MIPSSDKKNIAIRFFQVGLAYFLVTLLLGVIMIMGRGYAIFGPQGAKIAHVHAGVLGFVTLIIMGAMYQILPTLTGSKLYGEELAYRQFLLISLGIFGLFLSQLLLSGKTRNLLIIIFGGFVLGASLLFAYLIFKTASTSKSKIKPITIPFFKAATPSWKNSPRTPWNTGLYHHDSYGSRISDVSHAQPKKTQKREMGVDKLLELHDSGRRVFYKFNVDQRRFVFN